MWNSVLSLPHWFTQSKQAQPPPDQAAWLAWGTFLQLWCQSWRQQGSGHKSHYPHQASDPTSLIFVKKKKVPFNHPLHWPIPKIQDTENICAAWKEMHTLVIADCEGRFPKSKKLVIVGEMDNR